MNNIARNNKAVAKLVGLTHLTPSRNPGSAKGKIWMSDDFDLAPQDFKEYR